MRITHNNLSKILLYFCAAVFLLSLAACGSSSSDPFPYTATIQEGRNAANEIMAATGAASVSVAFVDGERLVWAETFADPTKDAPTTETMYPICSVSKMIATIAAMRLVDMGLVSLDRPLTDYIPTFSMFSAAYTSITVKMLLNHSSGFPGSDYRNAVSYSPLPSSRTYSAQALTTITTERLKHDPGYMSVYCNDGFTMIEELVFARTGKTYVQFVQDEILTPLGMAHSRYTLDYFPAGSYARRYAAGSSTPTPQVFLNAFGSGGLYSTPTDMAKIAMMLAGGGKVGNTRILEASSVSAMGVDQTVSPSFDPVKSKFLAYGLGWDSVMQPALDSVGVVGWMKTGDFALNGAVIVVVPSERLGVVVMGTSGSFNSGNATAIAERILLRALAEKGRIAAMPVRLTATVLPEKTAGDAILDGAEGYYANNSTFMRVKRNGTTLDIEKYDPPSPGVPGTWIAQVTGLKYRNDDRFSTDGNPSESYSFITAEGRQYVVQRSMTGYHYCYDDNVTFQKVSAVGALGAAWSGRDGKIWLLTNDHPTYDDRWQVPLMMLNSLNIPSVGIFYFANSGQLQVVNQSDSDTLATMMLRIPQMQGKELNDVVIEIHGAEEWIRWGSYLFRPSDSVTALSNGTVTVGTESEWRSLDCTATTATVTITPSLSTDRWRIYNSNFNFKQSEQGTGTVTLSGEKFYLVFHATADISGL